MHLGPPGNASKQGYMVLMFYPGQTCQWEEAEHLEGLSIPSHVLVTYYRLAHRDMYK